MVRLVVAVVFLGAFVGLNMRRIGPKPEAPRPQGGYMASYLRGWPLPFTKDFVTMGLRQFPPLLPLDIKPDSPELARELRKRLSERQEAWARKTETARCAPLPWTHQTYRLSRLPETRGLGGRLIVHAIIDALVGIIPLTLMLFLQIPRRKEAARVE